MLKYIEILPTNIEILPKKYLSEYVYEWNLKSKKKMFLYVFTNACATWVADITIPCGRVISTEYHQSYCLFFISIVFFRVSLSILTIFLISALFCAQHAYDSRIFCHSHNLYITSKRQTCIQHTSKKSETDFQWWSLKYDLALKSHPNAKVHINYMLLFCKHNWSFEALQFFSSFNFS